MNRVGNAFIGDGWIEVYGGELFNVIDPSPDSIRIGDIAHSLAMQCRYNGHCSKFYSVAEHCCHVCGCVQSEFPGQRNRLLALASLLHDASEAYLTDIVRPLKPLLTNYVEIEAKLQAAIYERFGIPPEVSTHESIKRYDSTVCRAEAEKIMRSGGSGWNWGDVTAADIEIGCWVPQLAENAFMCHFWQLYEGE